MSRSKKQVALDALEAWNRVGLAGDGEERSTGYYFLYFHVSFLALLTDIYFDEATKRKEESSDVSVVEAVLQRLFALRESFFKMVKLGVVDDVLRLCPS